MSDHDNKCEFMLAPPDMNRLGLCLCKERALKARLAEAERHLALVLPMAKGYASAHRVGANAEIVEDAAEFLRATDSADQREPEA